MIFEIDYYWRCDGCSDSCVLLVLNSPNTNDTGEPYNCPWNNDRCEWYLSENEVQFKKGIPSFYRFLKENKS